jgi:SAM-dependent methyltransferase
LKAIAEYDAIHGYNIQRQYTQAFFDFYDPRRIAALAAAGGRPHPDTSKPFTYADFGCGFGMTAVLFALAMPHGQFYAIDLMEEHVETGRAVADQLGLTNITFICASFDALQHSDLPPLDFATAHGILTWVAPEVRTHLREKVRNFLKDDGLFVASFNHVAGWGEVIAARDLLKFGYDHGLSEIEGANLVTSIIRAGVEYNGRTEPRLLRSLEKENPGYLQHEFLNEYWACFTNRDVAAEMALSGLTFIGPWRSPMHEVPVARRPKPISESLFWEDAIFLRLGASFQRAIFAIGDPASPMPGERTALPDGYFTLIPGKNIPETSPMFDTELGPRSPFRSLPVDALDTALPDMSKCIDISDTLQTPNLTFLSRSCSPQHDIGSFALSEEVATWLTAQVDHDIQCNALGLSTCGAAFNVPVNMLHILKTCAGGPVDRFALTLAEDDGLDEAQERHEASVRMWHAHWAPWLAGLGAITPL